MGRRPKKLVVCWLFHDTTTTKLMNGWVVWTATVLQRAGSTSYKPGKGKGKVFGHGVESHESTYQAGVHISTKRVAPPPWGFAIMMLAPKKMLPRRRGIVSGCGWPRGVSPFERFDRRTHVSLLSPFTEMISMF